MQEKNIWNQIKFDPMWNNANTEKFDNIYPSWERKRSELSKEPKQYERFIDQLKRKQAIDTGIIEQMYDENSDIPLGLPPLTMSSEIDPEQLASSIDLQVEASVIAALAYIANEL